MKVYTVYKVYIKSIKCIKCVKCIIKCCSPPAPQASYPTSIGFIGMIKNISNRKTNKMRYCEYSYDVNCVFSFQLCFFKHPLLYIINYVNKKQHKGDIRNNWKSLEEPP
jgi:hypothetical protein